MAGGTARGRGHTSGGQAHAGRGADRHRASRLPPRARDQRRRASRLAARAPQQRDELWRRTCCECFARREAEAAYLEFNFSPSGDWAVYRFEGYRRGQSRPELAQPGITLHALGPGQLRIQARAQLPDAPPLAAAGAWQIGLAAVIEAPVQPEALASALMSALASDPRQRRAEPAPVAAAAVPEAAPSVAPASPSPSPSPRPAQPLKVLVADDNSANCKILKKVLEMAGHQAVVVGDGEAALAALERDRFDLALLDTARALGLGGEGRNSPFMRALARCCQFEMARPLGDDVLSVRRRLPPLNRRQLHRLSPKAQQEHDRWLGARPAEGDIDQRRVRHLAVSLAQLGEDLEGIERQLLAWKFSPALIRPAAQWAFEQHRLRLAAPLAIASSPSPR